MAHNSRPKPPSRTSTLSQTGSYTPATPSTLRQSSTPSNGPSTAGFASQNETPSSPTRAGPSQQPSDLGFTPTEQTPLLRDDVDLHEHAHEGPCNHGTFSPRPESPTRSVASEMTENGTEPGTPAESDGGFSFIGGILGSITGGRRSWRRRLASKMRSKKMTTSRTLAERHGVRDTPLMYLSYYFPVLIWVREYKWAYLKGDLIAAITLAGMYVPMALSLADTLAHVPPINGLYSFVFNPFVYAMLGSSPQMVVGPEAAGSLLVGSVVKSSIDNGRGHDADAELHARICGVVAGMAGATVLLAGLARLGFLDNVLSRPFLRGFISAIGVVIAVDQLIPELGLTKLAETAGSIGHGSSVEKLQFIFSNLDQVHALTFAIAGGSFVVVMVFREVKRRLQPRYPSVAYFPDRFIVVVVSAILAWQLDWENKGVAIFGKVEAASGHTFAFQWPFQPSLITHIKDGMGTAFLIALLGFFESSVAAKSLGGADVFPSIQLSPNRELVALGVANFVGACFMSLPAFGGYGRSKVNKSTGGKTPMSSIFLSIIVLIVILFLLDSLYYLPKPVLSALISVVAWSLIEECPHDIAFFVRIRAWKELGLMLIIVVSTIFYSLSLGIAIGVGLSLLMVIRHSTRPRIQILGRVPGTQRFENAELANREEQLEFVDGSLIVKIPEPLTFANTGELRTRLRRLELYGTSQAHPALPRLRGEDLNRNIIFDIHGVTSLDGSGAQVLEEIVHDYRERGVRVFFSRGPADGHPVRDLMQMAGIVDLVGGEDHFVDDVHDALKMTEAEDGGHSQTISGAA